MVCTCDKSKTELPPLVFRHVSIPSTVPAKSNDIQKTQTRGRHWTHVLVDLAAVVVKSESYSTPLKLHSVSRDAVREHKCASSTWLGDKWFILQPDELLLKIDLCLDGSNRRGLHGVRFTTTMRETLWYGDCVGSEVTSLEAPSDHFINGVYSSTLDGRLVELGMRVERRDADRYRGGYRSNADAACPLLYLPRALELPPDKQTQQVIVSRFDLRAISVTWDGNSSLAIRVDVLSCRDYEQVTTANRHGLRQPLLVEHEDMMVLTVANGEIEAITRVEVAYKMDIVAAVRFTTTRGGQWPFMGQYSKNTQRVVTHEIPSGL